MFYGSLHRRLCFVGILLGSMLGVASAQDVSLVYDEATDLMHISFDGESLSDASVASILFAAPAAPSQTFSPVITSQFFNDTVQLIFSPGVTNTECQPIASFDSQFDLSDFGTFEAVYNTAPGLPGGAIFGTVVAKVPEPAAGMMMVILSISIATILRRR